MTNTYFQDDDCDPNARSVLIATDPVERFYAEMRPQDASKARRCLLQEVARLGYDPSSVREGSRTWDKARALVATNMLQAKMTFAEVEFNDDPLEGGEPPKKARRVTDAS